MTKLIFKSLNHNKIKILEWTSQLNIVRWNKKGCTNPQIFEIWNNITMKNRIKITFEKIKILTSKILEYKVLQVCINFCILCISFMNLIKIYFIFVTRQNLSCGENDKVESQGKLAHNSPHPKCSICRFVSRTLYKHYIIHVCGGVSHFLSLSFKKGSKDLWNSFKKLRGKSNKNLKT